MNKFLYLSVISLFCNALQAAGLTLVSDSLSGQLAPAQVYDGFGCKGGNISPALHWSGAPAATRSFAVTLYDPDAPTGSGWWHWLVFNIPAKTQGLPEGAGSTAPQRMPAGVVQSRTDFGKPGFGGACPPRGDRPHRYLLTVYALDVERLPLDTAAAPALVGFQLNRHSLARSSTIAYYGRP